MEVCMILLTTRSHITDRQELPAILPELVTSKGFDALNILKQKNVELLNSNPFRSLASQAETNHLPVKLNKIYALSKL